MQASGRDDLAGGHFGVSVFRPCLQVLDALGPVGTYGAGRSRTVTSLNGLKGQRSYLSDFHMSAFRCSVSTATWLRPGMPLMVWGCPTSRSHRAGGSVPRCTCGLGLP